jgi:hypothetical protein
MKRLYLLFTFLFLASGVSAREATYVGELELTPHVEKSGGLFNLALGVGLDDVYLRSQRMLVFTPVLRSASGVDIHTFAPMVVTGRARHRALVRAMAYDNADFEQEPSRIVVRRNGRAQSVAMSGSVPYGEWMDEAQLVLVESATGCVGCGPTVREYVLWKGTRPVYVVSYITPPVEPVKERSDSYVTRINYVVDRWELRRDFMDNRRILDEVDKIITEIKNDPYLTVTSCSVVGYASPEGNYERNVLLAENRARTFMNYLRDRHGWDMGTVKSEGRGEDWEGLREAVNASQLSGRQAVLDIIDNYSGTQRKARMRALPSYHSVLIPQYYAPLRRNEYRVAYTVRGFSVEEARELVRTKPQLLSLNELFLVANSYPKGSDEYKYAFDVAARMFPQDATASLNAGAAEVEAGAYDSAIARLSRLSTPEALNNLGVAYARQGDLTAAEASFRKAVAAGSADAAHNLEQLNNL